MGLTEPVPTGLAEVVSVYRFCVKVAVTDSLPFMVIVVELPVVLERSGEPLHPLKLQPGDDVAVRVTDVPLG